MERAIRLLVMQCIYQEVNLLMFSQQLLKKLLLVAILVAILAVMLKLQLKEQKKHLHGQLTLEHLITMF